MAREQHADQTTADGPITRRTYLRLGGALVGSMALSARATDTVTATTLGYGESGYGDGGYGGTTTDPTVTLSTITDITESSATIAGDVSDLGTADAVTATVQYRQHGTTRWTTTSNVSLSSPSSYTVTVTNLAAATTYDVRAAVMTQSGATVTSSVKSLTTAATDTPSEITRFDITTSEQLGDDRIFTVQWAARDVNHDLDIIEVVVAQSSLSFNFAVTDVSGTTAEGWDMFQFPTGTTLDVSLRVTDDRGHITRESHTVSL